MQKVVLNVGFPGSGKSTSRSNFPNYTVLCRDDEGGKIADLLPKLEKALKNDESVILDCTFMSKESRKPFIDMCKSHNVDIECAWYATSIEDCQINVLNRMWDRYGQIFMDKDSIKNHKDAKKDSNMFPINVLFSMRKSFETPSIDEGFSCVTKIKFERKWDSSHKNKAIFLDYDGTLRETVGGNGKFPVKPSEVAARANVIDVLVKYGKQGYRFVGVSNQSGIAKGDLTKEDAEACFDETNKQVGLDIEYMYCPHRIPPASCYCRKPQSGMAMHFIKKYSLNPKECIMVGDMTSDKTFAERLGMKFVHADEFFVIEDEPEVPVTPYTVEHTKDGISVNGVELSKSEAKDMISDIWEALSHHNDYEIFSRAEIDTSKIPQCYFACGVFDPSEKYDEMQYSFLFDRGEGKPRADAYYESTKDEKEYLELILREVKLHESMENSYESRLDQKVVVERLKDFGLKEIECWWH